MTFQDPNWSDISPDRASLQPKPLGEAPIHRDKAMAWKPDLVLDSIEWVQRAQMGDPKAAQEVVFIVAPALIKELKNRE